MINLISEINWWSVLIALVAYSMLGGLWFTVFFTKAYKRSLGKSGETLPNKPIFIIGPAICCLAIILASAILIQALHIQNPAAALEFSMVIGLGFLVANTVNIAINPNIPRPGLYGIISGTYHLVGISMVSVILVAMN